MLQQVGFQPPAGLLAKSYLDAPLPIRLPGVARVWQMPVYQRIGPGPRVLRCWAIEGETDADGRLEVPLWAAISVIQTPSGFSLSGGASATKAFGSNITAGSAILLSIAGYNDTGSGALPSSISDTLSNTYTVDASHVGVFLSFRADFIASAPNSSAGANTVTINYGAGASYYVRGAATEVAGLATSSILDATHKANATTTGPTDSVTTLTANTFVLGHMGSAATNNRTVTETTGTLLVEAQNGSSEPIMSAQYLIASSTGSKTHSWTVSGTAAAWGVLLCAYKAAGATAYTLTAGSASYAWTGQSATLKKASAVSAGSSSYDWTPQSATLSHGFGISAGAAAYSWAGQVASLVSAFNLSAGAGSYAWTGQAVTLSRSNTTMAADGTSWSWTGQTVSMKYIQPLQAEAGAWQITWSNVLLRQVSTITLQTNTQYGVYVLNPKDSKWTYTRIIFTGDDFGLIE